MLLAMQLLFSLECGAIVSAVSSWSPCWMFTDPVKCRPSVSAKWAPSDDADLLIREWFVNWACIVSAIWGPALSVAVCCSCVCQLSMMMFPLSSLHDGFLVGCDINPLTPTAGLSFLPALWCQSWCPNILTWWTLVLTALPAETSASWRFEDIIMWILRTVHVYCK